MHLLTSLMQLIDRACVFFFLTPLKVVAVFSETKHSHTHKTGTSIKDVFTVECWRHVRSASACGVF